MKGTRGTVLDEIELWTRNFTKSPVYWLNGLAGTGKSAVTQTIAERVFADGQLGASFCSRNFEDRFVPLVQSNPGIAYESLYNQMNKLIVQPLRESTISTVIMIDALDECKDGEPTSEILTVLGEFVSEIPEVKFFIAARPEPRMREGFRLSPLSKIAEVFLLHNVQRTLIDNDIRLSPKQGGAVHQPYFAICMQVVARAPRWC